MRHTEAPGRIITFKNDDAYNNGLVMLTDEGASCLEYKEVNGCQLFTFPLTETMGTKFTLSVLKQGTIHPLLTSEEQLPDTDTNELKKSCLAHDTYFKILRTNKAVFEVDKDADGFIDDSDEAAFEKAFDKKDYINAIICTSDTN